MLCVWALKGLRGNSMDEGWKIRIERPLDCMVVRIWIYRDTMESGGRTRIFITDLKNGTYTIIQEGGQWMDVKPAIELQDRLADAILQPLVEALLKDGFLGDPKRKDATDELTATKYHLEDMREIMAHATNMKPELVIKRREVKEDPGF